jgi:hypothetical protein
MVTSEVVEQPLLSVTLTLYVPAARDEITLPVTETGIQLNV